MPERRGYWHWSRDPAVGMFAVVPLWILYEGLRVFVQKGELNGAEALLVRAFDMLGPYGLFARWGLFLFLFAVAARSLWQRQVPWVHVAAVVALEGTVYGLLLGPSAGAMTSSASRLLEAAAPEGRLLADLAGSIGAGIFEELVFRLGLMSVLVWIGVHAIRAWSLPRWLVGLAAVIGSALVFSWFHHLCGESFDRTRFLFRVMAGVLLGLLMWFRGFGVCVYAHTFYDVHFYLTQPT